MSISFRESLARISVGLLAGALPASGARAQSYEYGEPIRNDNFGPGFNYSQIDAALLVYQESGGRVMAIEPTMDLTVHAADGRALTLNAVADTVSGATPNGAVPSDKPQNFVTPLKAAGSSTTVTSASGGSTVIQLPPTPGQVTAAALGRQYTVVANTLPVDKGFHDHRAALGGGWTQPVGAITDMGFNLGYSRESDYQAITTSGHVDQTFNAGNTNVSLALNGEFDSSFPFGGIPTPLTQMNAQFKTPISRNKTQAGFVLGLTEVMTRRWLLSLNYAFDNQSGYQSDPYRIISLVDPLSGEPVQSLYESRPTKRTSQSIYWDNKFDWGRAVTDLSARYYTDSWGVRSSTVELDQRFNVTSNIYIEPSVRWYDQKAASFFRYFLVQGQTMPAYASSDMRLGAFHALTYGAKIGFSVSKRSEIYLKAEYYHQGGDAHPAAAFGQLRQQNLFSGTNAAIAFIGYSWDFH